jgi:hypothetical protein
VEVFYVSTTRSAARRLHLAARERSGGVMNKVDQINDKEHAATQQSIVEQIREIEANLRGLELGNDDVRFELLRKRNQLRRGDPNRLDQDLLDEYLREITPS